MIEKIKKLKIKPIVPQHHQHLNHATLNQY